MPANEGALDDYDQMIFKQFMGEDEREMLAQQLQNEMNGQIGGGGIQQNNNDLNIRKADSEKFG